jgi:hypothetical protein
MFDAWDAFDACDAFDANKPVTRNCLLRISNCLPARAASGRPGVRC